MCWRERWSCEANHVTVRPCRLSSALMRCPICISIVFAMSLRRCHDIKIAWKIFLARCSRVSTPTLTLTNHSTPNNWRIGKLVLELVSPKGRLWKKWNTKKRLRIAVILCQCVVFATYFVCLLGAKIRFYLICFSIIPFQPFRKEIVIHSVSILSAGNNVLFQQALQC